MRTSRSSAEAFEERHPELHEKSQEAIKDVLEKRSEINTELRGARTPPGAHGGTPRGAGAALSAALGRNIIHERIARAYPHLAEGEHNGSHFRTLLERADKRRKKKKGQERLKYKQNAPVKPVRFSVSKKRPRRSRPQTRKQYELFSVATCAWQKTLCAE